jgi:serine/threonine protein kinase
MHYIILRVFESFIIIEDDLPKIIIPTSKLFFIVDEDQTEYKRRLLFPLQLISQLSYENKKVYQFYFLSFQNRDKFVYQLKCILGNFNFNKQFILDKSIYENKYYSLYLGRKNDMFQSTIIKIKGSRYEEIDDLENSERFQIKIISKNCIKNLKNLIDEIEISKLLSNITYPNINNIENLFEDNNNIYIIFEHYYGDNISLYCDYSIEEKYELIKQLYKGIKNLHNIGIIHTNLIPDFIFVNEFHQIVITHINEAHLNLLFESNSSIIKNNKNYSFDCPEIIENKKCNYKVDYWNIGLISFYLLYGFFPIDKDNYYTFNLEKIMQKLNWELNNKKIKKINKEILQKLNSLIMNCLKLIPDDRGDEIEEILQIKRTQNRLNVK